MGCILLGIVILKFDAPIFFFYFKMPACSLAKDLSGAIPAMPDFRIQPPQAVAEGKIVYYPYSLYMKKENPAC
jgi:hypothetical protein